MNVIATPTALSGPTVYFIDDSATMREVIKIAFRKENISVIACHNAAAALEQFSQHRPDAVISDVIMPDKDGFEVCQFVKEHSEFGATPVILMSGVVNRQVAERALAVKADDLIRKPFQPHDLIARVKALLKPKSGQPETSDVSKIAANAAALALGNLFAPAASSPVAPAPAAIHSTNQPLTPAPALVSIPAAIPAFPTSVTSAAPKPPAPAASSLTTSLAANLATSIAPSPEISKLRNEIRRLELLVKKLQSELEGERQYNAELES
ncbi:MAG: response regulator, partial [Candidatus Acidiferrales bacterium]